jgi:hypothetical protein
MRPLRWWLRIVGVLYVLEGAGLSLMALFDPDQFASIWSSTEIGTLDALAVRGIRIAGLPGVLTWALLGAMMLIFSRVPARARMLVVTVAAWELLVWLPVDLVAMFNGFGVARAATLITIHVVIGVSGIVLLRRQPGNDGGD